MRFYAPFTQFWLDFVWFWVHSEQFWARFWVKNKKSKIFFLEKIRHFLNPGEKWSEKFFSCRDFDSNFLAYFGPKNTYAFSARALFPLYLARKSHKTQQDQWKINENQWKLTYMSAKSPLFQHTVPGMPILMGIKCFSVDSECFYVAFQWFWWLLLGCRMENHWKSFKMNEHRCTVEFRRTHSLPNVDFAY